MIEAGTFPITAIQQEAEAYFDIVGRERGSGYKQYKRWEYVALMELDGAGIKIPNAELARRARYYRTAARDQGAEFSGFGGSWKQLGPTYRNATSGWNPGVGRVTSIGIDLSNTQHLIVGSPTGGVWKTLDGGDTWAPLTDDFSTVDVYALEISPYDSKHYLWGSTSGRIYRSTDGGATWIATGNVGGSGRVSRIQFHPTDPNVVYAVSESNGLYRSTNSGATWGTVSGANGTSGYDVEFKPGDPSTIYFSGRNVYRSTNGGASFSQVTGFGTASNNYKMMGVSPANPNVVYVLESNGGVFGAFYKSTDSGASYTKLIDGAEINFFGYSATGDDDRGQAPRDMDVAVNPYDANEVHIAGIHTWKSVNGGTSFELTSHWVPSTAQSLGVGYNHADIDILKFAGDTLYVGSDGGIYISTDGAESFIDRTSGLGIREFYKIGVSKTNPNVVSGGSQDNGTSVMRGTDRVWVDWLGADGMETFVDWNNANILYGTSQNGSMYRSTNQGNSRTSISKPPDVGDGAWVTPFEQDPQVAATIYVAFADVWKSTNSGNSWTKISNYNNGNMSQMKLAPSDNKRIYVSRGSSLFTTADGGTNWKTTTAAWASSTISYIAVHPQNPERVLIVTSAAVYHSTNAGTNWTLISAGLPSGTKYCATWENTGKNGIYVGGFGFVAYINDELSTWATFFDGLPNARVYELEINYVSKTIFAGTYGRGLWESPLYQLSPPVAAFSTDRQQGCRETTLVFTDKSANHPSAWEWTFEGGTPATSNLQHPTVTFSGSGTHTVRLKSSNLAGENTVEAVDYITISNPAAPTTVDATRCGQGEVLLQASGQPGEQIRWYASETASAPISGGTSLAANLTQTTDFYASASTDYLLTKRVGPATNAFGNGGDYSGDYFLVFDAERPFRLKSARVYAVGAKNRKFQLRDADGNVLLEKTILVSAGESRVVLDMDIPKGANLQIGCTGSVNLSRNTSNINYPYTLDGLMKITTSSTGLGQYYYLYDMEVESAEVCESERVVVRGIVGAAPEAPVLTAAGTTVLCPGAIVELTASNVCTGCTVNWSNGATAPSIIVSTSGIFTATVQAPNNTCGESPASNALTVSTETAPDLPTILASGPTALCAGESVVLTVSDICSGCTVKWSNGETGASISVSTAGDYTATLSNICGEKPAPNAVSVSVGAAPAAPTVSASGPTALCAGETVVLTISDICPDCTVKWSNGETSPSITVTATGDYTATLSNICGESLASNTIPVVVETAPAAPTITASGQTALCSEESVTLSVSNLCPDCTVNWSNGETSASITVATAGTYTTTLRNACGESLTSNAILVTTGMAPTAPTVTASGSTVLCLGTTVVLTADNTCPNCTVNWSNGETGPSIIVATPGTYTATFSNDCGTSPASDAVAVTTEVAPDVPTISASGPTALCAGETVLLTVSNICPGCAVKWSNGETGPSLSISAAGDYTATLHNACGESLASNAVSVTVGTSPAAPLISASGPTALCAGETVVLTANDICPDCTVKWSNGEVGPSLSVSAAGDYTATLSNACGESLASNALTVTVGAAPAAPTVSASGPTALCSGETVLLSIGDICPDCTVKWSNGASGPSVSVSTTGTYTATLNNACGESLASNAIEVIIYPPFLPTVQVSNLCNLAAPTGSNYQWSVNGNQIPEATGQFWAAQVAGLYVVSMTNAEGCLGTSEPVSAEACASSVHSAAGTVSARLYPNPAQHRAFLDIRVLQTTSAYFDLYAADGRYIGRLFQGNVLPGGQMLDIQLPALPAGVYEYRLVTEIGSLNGSLVVQQH